ncbi:dynactin subunit 4 isoform X2 [Coccinella septempunctata]|nr:dynactin subunit 4 isoform X2 [Coccinella septempunctata]XP_044757995.1 dynactin subunit 4 isoform X2 [Coccinella septempunctata]XP_044757996.1 dynactin subunit 4 isoform X2 [Coccinella septempunctata]XP_044757997.1 dynactin subunit 4 isoform X2 [Coccinella septempunctata]
MSAGYLDIDCVKYPCSCGHLKTLQQLFFCRYCSQLRCSFCVTHEVDSHYCGKCCENLPSAEAKLKKNRCVNCFVCPSCYHELSTRVATKTSAEELKSYKRSYYLSCLCCRWSSRDIGLPDQAAATGSWPKRESVHANRIQDIINMHRGIQEKEKLEKEFFKKKQKEKIISYTDKTGITAAALRKRIGLPEDKPLMKPKNTVKMVTPSIAEENIYDFNEDILTKAINIMELTSMEQRLLQPDLQPSELSKIYPIQKMLSIKRVLRCRSCDHNVSKPEYNPNSIKFKIQLFALYHVPEIRIVTVEPLRAGKPCELILKFTNPTQHQMAVALFSYDTVIETTNNPIIDVDSPKREEQSSEESDKSLTPTKRRIPSGIKYVSMMEDVAATQVSRVGRIVPPRPIDAVINCSTEFSSSNFLLPPRDDAAEYDDFNENQNIQDDKKLIIWRKSNKAYVKFIVKPHEDIPIGTPIIAGLTISHVHTNITGPPIENKKLQKTEHKCKVVLNIGNSVGSD